MRDMRLRDHRRDRDAVAGLVGIEGGIVSDEIHLESSGIEAPDRKPRHDEDYHAAWCCAAYSQDGC